MYMVSFVILLLLFVLPFVVFPIGVSAYEIPKIFLAELLIELAVVITIWKGFKVRFDTKNVLYILLIALTILAILHLALYPTNRTFFGNIYRFQGVLLLLHLVALTFVSSYTHVSRFFIPSFLALVFLCVTALFFPMTIDGRAVGTLGEPNSLAALVLFIWPIVAFTCPFIKWKRFFQICCFLAATLILALSGSRSGWLGLTFQLVFLVSSKRLSLRVSTLLCSILLGASFMLPFREDVSMLDSRKDIWMTAIHAGFSNPILGGGFGNTEFQLSQSAVKLSNSLRFNYVDSSHNIFLDWWVQGGIVGLLLFVSLIVLTIYRFVVERKILYIMLFIGLLACLSFNPASIVTLIAFWWLVGQARLFHSRQ